MFEKAKELYKLQKQARDIKAKLKNTHIESENEGVTIVITGEQKVVSVKIAPEATGDIKKLEGNLEKVFNKAIEKSQQVGAEMMKDVMGGLNLPGLG